MATIAFTKSTLITLGVIDAEDDMTDDAYSLFSSIALDRLQALLCDTSISLEALDVALVPLMQDLITWVMGHSPSETGIQSETTENYSYTRNSEEEANYLIRLRELYADIIKRFSLCTGQEGAIMDASHRPLWTPDYYREAGGIQ